MNKDRIWQKRRKKRTKSFNLQGTYGDDRIKNLSAEILFPAATTFPGLKSHVMRVC